MTSPLIIGVWSRTNALQMMDVWNARLGERINEWKAECKVSFSAGSIVQEDLFGTNGTDVLQVIRNGLTTNSLLAPKHSITYVSCQIFFIVFIPNVLYTVCPGGRLSLKCCFYCFILCLMWKIHSRWSEHTGKNISRMCCLYFNAIENLKSSCSVWAINVTNWDFFFKYSVFFLLFK